MKLTASMMMTLDGVYQGPGGPDEDRRGGFDRGGWTAAHADEESWRFLTSMFERAVFFQGLPGWRGVELHDIEIVGFHPRKTLFDPGHDIVAREDVCPSLAARCRGCAHQTATFAG